MARKRADERLAVWLDDPRFGPLQRIGTLARGERGAVRFTHEAGWIRSARAFQLDPELALAQGDFYPAESNFGVFMDSCPDRWGQTLMRRRELIEAKEAGRAPRELTPWDFLCGVQDVTRMGALRFGVPDGGAFIADEALAAPPVARLAELQAVALELSRRTLDDPDKLRAWLKVLVAPGASLGGARPKANLTDADGSLWIAKFPAADDDHDVALWEMLLHDLAREAGLEVPVARLERIGRGHYTYLSRRFDREGAARVFFTSAMALLGRRDREEASYVDLAELIASHGDPEWIDADLRELFARVAFNVAVANRDDHLRNHGFLRYPEGWRLAPAFDLNPSFAKDEHELALDEARRAPSLATVLETAHFYRLDGSEARAIVDRVLDAVSRWQALARRLGLSKADIARAEPLFATRA
jgi:serine/threonine-protein kinase HipA